MTEALHRFPRAAGEADAHVSPRLLLFWRREDINCGPFKIRARTLTERSGLCRVPGPFKRGERPLHLPAPSHIKRRRPTPFDINQLHLIVALSQLHSFSTSTRSRFLAKQTNYYANGTSKSRWGRQNFNGLQLFHGHDVPLTLHSDT
jgi:hypothetical protein